MSYSIDANLLLYASNSACAEHLAATQFIQGRATDPDLLFLTWPTLMAYLRISTHPSIFENPLSPDAAWANIHSLLDLPRVRLIGEDDHFSAAYHRTTKGMIVRGNLVPDAHFATILQQHGVHRLYTVDTDFLKFRFLEVVNPLEPVA